MRRGEERRGKERIVFNYISQCIHWHHTSQLLIFLAMHWKQLIWRLIVGPFLIPLHVTAVFAGLAALSHLLLEYSASVSSIGPKWKQAQPGWLLYWYRIEIPYWQHRGARAGPALSCRAHRSVVGSQSSVPVLLVGLIGSLSWLPNVWNWGQCQDNTDITSGLTALGGHQG